MKKILLAISAFILFVSASSQQYFEGTIEYDITYEPSHPGITEQDLVKGIGKSLKFYHKDGSYMRDYLDEQGQSIRKYIYLTTTNRVYLVDMLDPDTILYHDVSEKLANTYDITKGPTDTVLGCPCPSWVLNYRYFEKLFEDSVNTKVEYFFCHKLPVNPDYYKNYFIWYDIVKKEKSVALKFSEEIEGNYKIIYTAKKINHIKLSDTTFEFDKKAVLKHWTKNE